MTIQIHVLDADEALCPGCGEQGPSKVCMNGEGECGHWSHKCLTADCEVGYYDPQCETWDRRLTAEEAREMDAKITAQVDAMMEGKSFVRTDDGSVPGVERWELR